ncbi:hypothetical protein AAFN60_21285 [Roseibacillus persicicus]|uniref:hypothetical protein n=1 Tax=Roseibacillus persicicus TaxID=454148 RepID=UPI00398A738F
MKAVILTLAFASNLAIADELEVGWEPNQIQGILEVVDIKYGIDATEARALAESYFRFKEGKDGALWSMKSTIKSWRFETIVGQGTVGSEITIDREKGTIRSNDGPTMEFPYRQLRDWYNARTKAVK